MLNPFQPTKFEWEKKPVIWLSDRARRLTQSIKPAYIHGTRGSGKTTVLRSLSTRQLCTDNFLVQQFKSKKINWFGQYLQFNNTLQKKTSHLVELLSTSETDLEDFNQRLFYTFFEITLLHQFFNDIIFMLEENFLHFQSKSERNACIELYSIFSKSKWAKNKNIQNFFDARRLLRELQFEFLKSDEVIDREGLIELINLFPPGTLINFIKAEALSSIQSSHFSKHELDFFLLLDDCENLSNQQQIALNSYIRILEGKAKWVISFLSDRFNTTATNLHNTTLTDDDRTPIALDEMPEKDFKQFCQQVTHLRLTKFLEQNNVSPKLYEDKKFSFDKAFGEFSYNSLIDEIIETSDNKKLIPFRDHVMSTKGAIIENIKHGLHDQFHCSKDQIPYVEHIVIKAMSIKISNYVSKSDQQMLLKTIDGKQAAAYIAFCAQYNCKPIFAGKNMIASTAHNCIRDYLDTIAQLFEIITGAADVEPTFPQLKRVIDQFLTATTPINFRSQNKAIQDVSYSKYRSLEHLKLSEPHINRLVLALAELQKILEHDFIKWTSVKTPVRGIFEVNLPAEGQEFLSEYSSSKAKHFKLRHIGKVLERLEYDRYIKITKTVNSKNQKTYVFALHRRLRPNLRCGLTGPYSPIVKLPSDWILKAINGDDGFNPRKLADSIFKTTNDDQLDLPL